MWYHNTKTPIITLKTFENLLKAVIITLKIKKTKFKPLKPYNYIKKQRKTKHTFVLFVAVFWALLDPGFWALLDHVLGSDRMGLNTMSSS